jgi:hypothetical protein
MAISTADIRGLFTKTLIDVYQERIRPTQFLRSFFTPETVPTKTVSIEVERMGEKVAVDVVRGTEGNRNSFSRSTEKIFEPPLFREYFDITNLDLYDRVLGSMGSANKPLFTALLNSAAERLGYLQDKIERAKELQCAQVFLTGVVTLKNGTNIDYKRKSGSIVVAPGDYFATNTDPFAVFAKGCDFLRKVGRSGDGTFNAILGTQALADLLANTKFTARQNYFNMSLDAVVAPVRNAVGATFHGIITAGAYKVQLWAYPQFYDLAVVDGSGNPVNDASGNPTYTSTPYMDPKQVVMFPTMPRFKFAHAAVPQLIGEPGQLPSQGEYVVGEFLDTRKAKHDYDIQSAPLAVPVAVDQIYTFQGAA